MSIPTGVTEKEYEIARPIILEGHDNSDNTEKIYTQMITSGIAYFRCQPVYEVIAIDEGLIANPVKVRDEIKDILNNDIPDYTAMTDYEKHIAPTIKHILNKVEGSDEKMILRMIKAKFSSLDLKFPKRPKTRSIKWSEIEIAIANLFHEEIEPTEEKYKELVIAFAPKSAAKWNRLYKLFLCVSEGHDAEKGLK